MSYLNEYVILMYVLHLQNMNVKKEFCQSSLQVARKLKRILDDLLKYGYRIQVAPGIYKNICMIMFGGNSRK